MYINNESVCKLTKEIPERKNGITFVGFEKMKQINKQSLVKKKIKLYPSWLKSTCPRFLFKKLNREKPTAILDKWDSTPHDLAVLELQEKFKEKGYVVATETWLEYKYQNYTLAHKFDLIAKNENERIIVEVKPLDRSYHALQYMIAQLLAHSKFDQYRYFVYEYQPQNGNFVAKMQPDFVEVFTIIDSKVDAALKEEPSGISSKACDYCPFASCGLHPQHDCSIQNGPFCEELCSC